MLACLLALAVAFTPQASKGNTDPFTNAKEPQMAIDTDHSVYVTFGVGDSIYLVTSQDSGDTYGRPILLPAAGIMALGMRRGPRICAYHGVITITANYATSKGSPGNLVAFRSADHGRTWSEPVQVNDVQGSAREGLHAMAVAPGGTLACVWLDLRGQGTQIYVATSHDGGANWSPNRLAYASPSGTVCQCCHPSAVFDAFGKLYVMFRNVVDGNRDLYLCYSVDGGRSFASATKLGEGSWKLDACPMDGGSLAVRTDGTVNAVWRREGIVYQSSAKGAEQELATGQQPWMATGVDGSYIAWVAGGHLFSKNPSRSVTELSTRGTDPVVAASPDGKLVVAAWADDGIKTLRLNQKNGNAAIKEAASSIPGTSKVSLR